MLFQQWKGGKSWAWGRSLHPYSYLWSREIKYWEELLEKHKHCLAWHCLDIARGRQVAFDLVPLPGACPQKVAVSEAGELRELYDVPGYEDLWSLLDASLLSLAT